MASPPPADFVANSIGFLRKLGMEKSLPSIAHRQDSISHIIRSILSVDLVQPGHIICTLTVNPTVTFSLGTNLKTDSYIYTGTEFQSFSWELISANCTQSGTWEDTDSSIVRAIADSWLQNMYNTLHGGVVASVSEVMTLACAKTVAGDKELFLGEMTTSYLSAARIDEKVEVEASILRQGRRVIVTSVDFRIKTTKKLFYTSRTTVYIMPVASL